ncbi:hypothetical protein K432DRAFT_96128 [Lepidopterella palustris CBS 459.81]|uniref:BZIP domain-containing protein n=1 Tax=Lepidopterella palustris CBS 459.81 TaxID=1314670 RepID=A0A8E2E6I6_9PEZI|nr:hypothetical protein K432DRAFT_96128 [Lepidopterella palustris CBS 459.81]
MVNCRASDAGPSTQPSTAPAVKRKRRTSCLGEQERRERKRAIDREAQRSLREKTKTHIAELERTIQILRDQDRNGATVSLLAEIGQLRQENERLRDVIDSVRSVVGSKVFSRAPAPVSPTSVSTATEAQKEDSASQVMEQEQSEHASFDSMIFSGEIAPSHSDDLDAMEAMEGLVHDSTLGISFNLDTVHDNMASSSIMNVADSPSAAAFAPFLTEMFGPSWRCPSPFVLHIGNAAQPATPSTESALCPMWKKSNELFGKVFSFRPGTRSAFLTLEDLEAGLLFLGIKNGWDTFTEWMQSPALRILKEVDEFLFCHLERLERLAATYKSFKLLKYYLNGSKEELEKVPEWLRPKPSQARTKHPIALDFFAWPTLRDRLVENHSEIFQTEDMSRCYSHYLKFDWPFSFEDTFFFDGTAQAYYPSPLFERYHRDLRFWTVTEKFYETFPEMMADIEGDRAKFQEVEIY